MVSVDGLAKLEQPQELVCREGESLEWSPLLFFLFVLSLTSCLVMPGLACSFLYSWSLSVIKLGEEVAIWDSS